jgi:hypothetical protein
VLVWRLDRWARSLVDLVSTLQELAELGVGFVSLTEALDMTTATGRAMAGLLAVFAQFEHDILTERVRAGLAEARLKASASDALNRLRFMHDRCGSYIMPDLVSPKSLAGCRSVALRCGAFWRGFLTPAPSPQNML